MARGAAFSSSNVGEELIINPATPANTSYGIITSIAAPGVGQCPSNAVGACAVMAYVQGYQSAQSSVGFVLKAPLTALGAWPMSAQQSLGMYGLRFVDLSLDCNSVPGCDPASNWYSAEKSGYSRDWLFNYIDIGLDVEGPHTQASDYEELIFTPPSGCDTSNDNLLAANFRNSGFRILRNSTFVGAANCTPTYGLALDSAGAIGQGVHLEHLQNMVEIGVVPACPIWCAPAVTIAGISLTGVNGSCNNSTCNSVLVLGTTKPLSGSWLQVMSTGSTTNLPYTLIDNVNSQSLTSTNDPAVSWNLDGTGKVSWTDANPADLTANGKVAFDIYNGVATFGGNVTAPTITDTGLLSKTVIGTDFSGQLVDASSVTLTNNTTGTAANLSGTPALPNGTTATTQSAGDNSAKLATTAYVRSETQVVWNCPIGGTSSTTQYCQWTLPTAITVNQYDLSTTGAVGCTTSPTIQVWDATANAEIGSFSVTIDNTHDFFNTTGSANVPASHALHMKVTTANSGCSTQPGAIVATITYQMQN